MLTPEQKEHLSACRDLGRLYMQKTAGALSDSEFSDRSAPLIKRAATFGLGKNLGSRGFWGNAYHALLGKRLQGYGRNILNNTAEANTRARTAAFLNGEQEYDTAFFNGPKRWFGGLLYRAGAAGDATRLNAAEFKKITGDNTAGIPDLYDQLAEKAVSKTREALGNAKDSIPNVTPPVANTAQNEGASDALMKTVGMVGAGALGLKFLQNNVLGNNRPQIMMPPPPPPQPQPQPYMLPMAMPMALPMAMPAALPPAQQPYPPYPRY